MRSDRERLLDVLDAIDRIEKYTGQGRGAFERDELIQTWVIHHIAIIGEAARAVSPQLQDRHSEVPWPKIIGMRNILVHGYFGIDSELVWSAVDRDLPDLKRQIGQILVQLGGP